MNKWVEIPGKSHNMFKVHKFSKVAKEAYEQIKQRGFSYTISVKDDLIKYESNETIIVFPRDFVKCECC
jgi:hypothetical protein